MIYNFASDNVLNPKLLSPINTNRFGCWTCTVVRKDKAVQNMIENGYTNLVPLFEFRNWIYELRDNPEYRCRYRRNGVKSLGPFTLEARKLILKKLLKAQRDSGYSLINDEEIKYIRKQWKKDELSSNYKE